MKLIRASSEHFETIFRILIDRSKWLSSQGNDQWPFSWLQRIKPEIKSSVKAGNFYCWYVNDNVAVIAELRSEPEELWDYDLSNSIYIHKLAVDSSAEKGRGKSALDHIRNQAIKDCRYSLRLDCVASNKALRNYYENYGFKLRGEKSNGEVNLALYEYGLRS